MKRFTFRLERVLAYRRMQEDLERARLSPLEAELEKRRAALEALHADFDREKGASAADPMARLLLDGYRATFERQSARLKGRIAEQQAIVDKQRQLLVLTRQKAEVLSKVRKKQLEGWERDFQKELDSLAMDSYLSRWTQ